MNPLCIDQGVGLIPWSPLARGFLAGNRSISGLKKENIEQNSATKRARSDHKSHRSYYSDTDFEIVERVKIEAEKKQVKPPQLALAWLLRKSAVTAPIIGASKMYQLEEAVQAATTIQLSEEDIKTLEELYQPHRVLADS